MRKLSYLLTLVLLSFVATRLPAQDQPFVLVPGSGIPDLTHSWVSWGDFDRDGDLDVAISGDSSGFPRTYVYRNDNGSFANSGFIIPQLTNGSVEWGDADNNGWLDLLISGSDSNGSILACVVPNFNGSLVNSPVILPFGVSYGQAHWGDFDNDGLLDILMAGNSIAKILHNNGAFSFTEVVAPLPAVTNASCSWVDYNNDGQPDVFICGHVDTGDLSKLFRNNHGIFTEVSVQPDGILGLSLGSAKWADLDRDGDMDLLISGVDTAFGYILIYENKGNDIFEKLENYTFNIFTTSMDIGDYDNDGLPDLIVNGKIHSCGGSSMTLLYHNEGGMLFNNFYTDIPGIAMGGVEFADYNNDGFTDLLLCGTDPYGTTATRLFRNTAGSPLFASNTPPLQPANLSVQQSGNTLTLKWDKAVDAETPQSGLMYNIFMGSAYDSVDVFSPMSDRATGFRRIACTGNTNQDTSWTITGMEQGTYYWSVQAVDNGFMSSVFAPVQSFTFTPTGLARVPDALHSVYPNPCSDRVLINTSRGSHISVTDIRGTMVLNSVYSGGIDVSKLIPGLYFAKVRTGDSTYTVSFVKQ